MALSLSLSKETKYEHRIPLLQLCLEKTPYRRIGAQGLSFGFKYLLLKFDEAFFSMSFFSHSAWAKSDHDLNFINFHHSFWDQPFPKTFI